jgi:hypothetical protein
VALTGSLRDFDLSYIFQIVSQEGKTGRLVLSLEKDEASVVFDRGRIVSASSGLKTVKKALMGYLVDVKGAPNSAVKRLGEKLKDDVHELADRFLKSNFVTTEELAHFVEVTVEDLTCELFLWKEGTYRFDVLESAEMYRIADAAASSDGITMEAARRVDEWERLRPHIGPQTVFVPSERAQREWQGSADVDPIDDPTSYVMSLLDGTTSVKLVCERAPLLSEFRVYETLGALMQGNWIVPLAEKYSSSIGRALERNILSTHATIIDTAVATVATALVVALVLVISLMVPNSVLRGEKRARQRAALAHITQEKARAKTAAARLYYHASKGYEADRQSTLRQLGLLSARDIANRQEGPRAEQEARP